MKWTKLTFGRHTGQTLPQIVFVDCDWFFWACETGVFEDDDFLQDEAERVYRRAVCIRIPQREGQELVVEYGIDATQGKFANVEIVPKDRRPHQGSTRTMRLPHFDLSVPRRFARYDKAGGKALVHALKVYVFGDGDCHLTKERCEAFFEDDSNFDLRFSTNTVDGDGIGTRTQTRR